MGVLSDPSEVLNNTWMFIFVCPLKSKKVQTFETHAASRVLDKRLGIYSVALNL